MTTSDIITSVIAILALLVSGLTAYMTLLSRFHCSVLPKRRPILTQINKTPYIILECEFLNDGAKPGYIEDMVMIITHDETGSELKFAPKYVKKEFNLFVKNELSDFSQFSGISLSAKDRRELFIAFTPLLPQFSPPKSGIFTIRTSIQMNGGSKWVESSSVFSLRLTENIVDKWTGPAGEALQVEAIEIGKSRTNYFGGNKRKGDQ